MSWFTPDADAMPTHLLYTIPSSGQNTWREWSEADGESITVFDCIGTVPIRHIQTAYLWGYRLTGGSWALLDSHSVSGMEGMPDSFPIPFPGTFYIVTRNTVGLSCPGNRVSVLPDVITGIPEGATPPARIQRWIDVQGRAHMTRPTASGLYFWQYQLGGKWSKARRHLILK